MNNQIEHNLKQLFEKHFGEKASDVTLLPKSGSYREYTRITSQNISAIGVYNSDQKENIGQGAATAAERNSLMRPPHSQKRFGQYIGQRPTRVQ